jgi:hypothetical protein
LIDGVCGNGREAFVRKMKKESHLTITRWDQWHKKRQDMVLKTAIILVFFVWSIGNEILEQWDTSETSLKIDQSIVKRDPSKAGCFGIE